MKKTNVHRMGHVPVGKNAPEPKEIVAARIEARRDKDGKHAQALERAAQRRMHPNWPTFSKSTMISCTVEKDIRTSFAFRVEDVLRRLARSTTIEEISTLPEGCASYDVTDAMRGRLHLRRPQGPCCDVADELFGLPPLAMRYSAGELYLVRIKLEVEDDSLVASLQLRQQGGLYWSSRLGRSGFVHVASVPGAASTHTDAEDAHREILTYRNGRTVRCGVAFDPLQWGFEIDRIPEGTGQDVLALRYRRVTNAP